MFINIYSIYKWGQCFDWAELLLTFSLPSTLTDVAVTFLSTQSRKQVLLDIGMDVEHMDMAQLTCEHGRTVSYTFPHQYFWSVFLASISHRCFNPVLLTGISHQWHQWHLTHGKVGTADMWTLQNCQRLTPFLTNTVDQNSSPVFHISTWIQ